jgi:predicted dinucleotide-binding enzyme
MLAVHWSRFGDVRDQAGDLAGKVVVTCSLPMNKDNTGLVVAHTSSGAEELARRKAGRPSLVYCGDDAMGKGVAAGLIRDVGFEPVDAGPRRCLAAVARVHECASAAWQHEPAFCGSGPYSSWRRHQTPVSLRPRGARSSHWYMPQRPSSPRE